LAAYKDAPLAEIANRAIGPVTSVLIIIATAISGLGRVNGDVLGASRVVYAGAKNELFPSFLGRVSARFSTPYLSIITFGALIFIVAAAGAFQQLAILASGALLLIYLAVVLSFVKFRATKKFTAENGFRVPAGFIIAAVAILSIIYVLSNLSKNELISTFVFLIFISLMYLVIQKSKSK
jgi:APA family basic amino acid/polyamine antiporter